MTDENTVIGFDGAVDDTCLVVMRRDPTGTWHIERADGPDAHDVQQFVDLITRQILASPRPPAEWTPPAPSNPVDDIRTWQEAYVRHHWHISDDQAAALRDNLSRGHLAAPARPLTVG